MKNLVYVYFILLISVICCTSCSTDQFLVKKNHHPRIRIEAQPVLESEAPMLAQISQPVQDPFSISSPEKNASSTQKINPTENILEKVLVTIYPSQKAMLKKVFHHHQKLGAAPKVGEDRTTGLIINLLALSFGIAALFMLIGMAHGNVWVYFVVGMVLAAAAIIMGFIGKMMALKAFGWIAGVVGIIAVVLLLIFLLLITVVHTTF